MGSKKTQGGRSQLKVKSIKSLRTAITLLDRLTESQKGQTLSEMARGLKLPKSSLHGIVATLERAGYLRRDSQSKRYLFGITLLHLTRAVVSHLQIRWVSAPLLWQLAKETGLTVNMAILELDEVVFIEKITPPGHVSPPTWIGKHMDLNCTAVGKVLVANLPSPEVDRFVSHCGMPKHNENASVSPTRFKQELEKVRKLGYAFNDEENEIGYRAIAVPIHMQENYGAVAISLAGRTSEIHEGNFDRLVRSLRVVARQIAKRLGSQSVDFMDVVGEPSDLSGRHEQADWIS